MEVTEIRKLAEVERQHWWYRERRVLLGNLLSEVLTDGIDGKVALDLGAAGGGNTEVLRDLGLQAVALEYEKAGAAIAQDRGLPVLQADARALPVADAVVDVVVAFDVLEHIADDVLAISEVHRVLRAGGWLLIAVPADMNLWSAHDLAVGHVRRYSRAELLALVEGGGFVVRDLWSWNVLMRPLVRLRRRGLRGSHLDEPGRIANTVLSQVIGLERRFDWLRQRRGVSLMMTARK